MRDSIIDIILSTLVKSGSSVSRVSFVLMNEASGLPLYSPWLRSHKFTGQR